MDAITNVGSALEGAASKAHLSPTHGTRAARELSHGHAWTDTDYGGLFSQCADGRTWPPHTFSPCSALVRSFSRCVVSMPQSKESSRFFSVEAVALPNLLSEKSCERERFSMRMCAAAKYSRQGGVVGLYAQRGPHPCSRMPPKSCVHSEASKSIA